MDRAALQATVHGVTKSQTRLSMHAQQEQTGSPKGLRLLELQGPLLT